MTWKIDGFKVIKISNKNCTLCTGKNDKLVFLIWYYKGGGLNGNILTEIRTKLGLNKYLSTTQFTALTIPFHS